MKSGIKEKLGRVPYFGKIITRKYYATGTGTLVVNYFFKKILRINRGADLLLHFTSQSNQLSKIKFDKKNPSSASIFLSLASSGHCYYQAINGLEIGVGALWAPGCQFISANHNFTNLKKSSAAKPIIIGEYVWIGANVVVLPEVIIGNHVIIGAGSIVTKSFAENTIVAGNPARAIANRCFVCKDKIPLGQTWCTKCNP